MARGTPTRWSTPRKPTDGDYDNDMSPTSNSAVQQAKIRAQALSTSTPTAGSAATTTPTRGPLPTSQETSYHKRLRLILLEHKRARRDWNELVIRGAVHRTRSVLELIHEVENGLNHFHQATSSTSNSANPATTPIPRKTVTTGNTTRAGYILNQSQRLSDQLQLLQTVINSLVDIENSLRQITDRAESLLLEASKIRGQAFAFREPMWVTWPLSKFVDGLQIITEPYGPSLVLIRDLISHLTSTSHLSPLITPTSLPNSDSPSSASTSTPISDENETDNGKITQVDSALLKQARMSLLAVQPWLPPGRTSDWSSEAWDEIVAVEMPTQVGTS